MNTKEFLDLILPGIGERCIAAKTPQGMQMCWGDTNEWAAAAAHRIDAYPNGEVYHACATYDGEHRRRQANVVAVRSFWLDIDCGPSKDYPDKRTALVELLAFTSAIGLPHPYVVKSGNGLHAYWPMSEDMTPDQWKATATLLKQATIAAQLKVDQTRTADSASVLRPCGTHHKKGQPKLVDLAMAGEIWDHDDFHAALAGWCTKQGIEADTLPSYQGPSFGDNDALKAGMEYAPKLVDKVAESCPTVRHVRDTKGNVSQPLWYHTLGIMAHCVDGEDNIHEWSNGYPRYTAAETDATYARVAAFGATSCQKFSELEGSKCASCPHFGKITSPIVLGGVGQVPKPEDAVSVQINPFGGADEDKGERQDFPRGYLWTHNPKSPHKSLCWVNHVKDLETGNDTEELVPFCESLFYPINRIEGADDKQMIEWETIEYGGRKKRFMVNSGIVSAGSSPLATAFGEQGIMASNGQINRLHQYAVAWHQDLRRTKALVPSCPHFGWYDRNFLVGTTLYTPTGEKPAIVVGNAKLRAKSFEPQGTLERWKEIVDVAYNYDGQEAFQFMVLLSFAAPLLNMFGEYGGITAFAHSEGSGVGKTTAQRSGLAAWGNWDDLELADKKTTTNFLWQAMGVYHNLPVMFDELTNQDNGEASDVVFSVSSGRNKSRLTQTGEFRENANWSTILMASGNMRMSEKISMFRTNAEAELYRLYEFTVGLTSTLPVNEANKLFPDLRTNYGHAGRVFIDYVVRNYDKVEQLLLAVRDKLNTQANITQPERYWSALMASVMAALLVCRELDLLTFPVAPLKNWMIEQLNVNRGQKRVSVTGPLEVFGRALADLSVGIISTENEGDIAAGTPAVVVHHPRSTITGRAIIQNKYGVPELILSTTAVKDWCNKNRASYREIISALEQSGWLTASAMRYHLGKGTREYHSAVSHVSCLVIDVEKMGSALGQLPMLQSVAGGKV